MDPVAEIKARVNVADYLSGYVELKKAGKNFKACCPFHVEKTPSFIISPERGFAWCFGCQTGGDVIKLCELLEGVDFKEAVKLLADKAGIQLTTTFGGGVGKEKKDRLIEINEITAEFFVRQLADSGEARDYLNSRGISPAMIKIWQIGYAPSKYEELYPKLLEKNFTRKELVESGVSGQKEMASEELFDRFRGRVMFPITNHRDRVVAFTGRILGDSSRISGKAAPKYLNSPESLVFQKGAILFGYPKARGSIRESGQAVVVEGQLDVVSCHQAGFTNVVASSGTAITEMHLVALGKITENVIFAFDADMAGVDSTKRAIELALREDLNVRIARFPEGCKDPDDVIQKDPKLLKESFVKTLSVFDFYFEVVYAEIDLSAAATKKKIARTMLTIGRNYASAIEKEEFLKQLALKLGISEAALREEAQVLPVYSTPAPSSPKAPTTESQIDKFSHEDLLIGLLLAFPDLVGGAEGITCLNPANRELFQKIQDSQLGNLDKRAEKLRLFASDKYVEFGEVALKKEVQGLAAGLQKKSHEEKLRELKAKMAEAEAAGNEEEAEKLFEKYQKLLQN